MPILRFSSHNAGSQLPVIAPTVRLPRLCRCGCFVFRTLLAAGATLAVAGAASADSLKLVSQAAANPADPATSSKGASLEGRDADFTAAADYSAGKSGRAVLVMQHGKIIFERYDNGWSASKPHPLASGTKSFTGVTAAIAIGDGLISGWDELVCDTITEWATDPYKKLITVRHLLTLSSGLDPADDTLGGGATPRRNGQRIMGPGTGSKKDAERGANAAADKFKAAVTTKSVTKPGARFEYGPSHYMAFGEFLQRKLTASKTLPESQKTVMGYMKAKLFDPIGLVVGRFGKDLAGNPNLPGGCLLTAQQWAKFGQLVLQEGTWKKPDGASAQIVRSDLLAECFKPSKANPAYGLTWWLLRDGSGAGADVGAVADGGGGGNADDLRAKVRRKMLSREASASIRRPDGAPWEIYMAAGLGKQRLYVLPQEDMVIVRFAENNRQGMSFDNGQFLSRLLGIKGEAAPK